MKRILVLNGPNLNMLGQREPEIYGHETLEQIIQELNDKAAEQGVSIVSFQSNSEGALVDKIQNTYIEREDYLGIIINAGAYTHTSIAIHDALKLFSDLENFKIIETHLSDPKAREKFRHNSYITQLADKVFKGKGKQSYLDALEFIIK
jgi:3-dehydroquinate dehydratase-2